MKKLLTLLFVVFAINMAKAQPWFDIGIKGGIGTSFMYNTQIFEDQNLNHKFMLGNTYGGKFGFNLNMQHTISFDVLKTTLKQKFLYYPETGVEANRQFDIKSLDYALLYRYTKGGTFFEFGPQLSQVSAVKYADQGGDFISPFTAAEMINKNLYSVVLGYGGYVFGTDNFGVTTGFRVSYNITDIATEAARGKNFPMLYPKDADPTHNLAIMFIVEANYDFGYLLSPSCGKRTKLFVF
ncbi:MAG: hypothetical protein ACM3ME_08315 [Chloroflexota bacterium]|jgi:hypothetical protein|nr:hypothetical protein [Lentimicrobium sp.]